MTIPPIEDVHSELRRLGFDPEDVPTLVLPATVSLADFISRLRELPDGAGLDAFHELMRALPSPPPVPWHEWPDPGDRFSLEEYTRAFAFINAAPELLAQAYAHPPRRVPAFVLALLAYVSPELRARVDAYREEVRRERRAAGVSPEVTETADAEYERQRRTLVGMVREWRRQRLGLHGPVVSFLIAPEYDWEQAHALFHDVMKRRASGAGGWLMGREAEGTRGAVQFAFGASPADCRPIERWLRRHAMVREVTVTPSSDWRPGLGSGAPQEERRST